MKPVLHSVGTWSHPNLRTWNPAAVDCVAEELTLSIGPKGGKTADTFYLRLATPRGLTELDDRDGIISAGMLLVIREYDFAVVSEWLHATVSGCEASTWQACVERLRRYFRWEYEEYKEV